MISDTERYAAQLTPVTAAFFGQVVEVDADYVAEMVRREMIKRFGNAAYNDGYVVYTTVDSQQQQAARNALLAGLRTYDWRHGWRGPERQAGASRRRDRGRDNCPLGKSAPRNADDCRIAARRRHPSRRTNAVTAMGKSGEFISLYWRGDLEKVRRYRSVNLTAAPEETPADLLVQGDLIRVLKTADGWRLSQVPQAQSALVSLDPKHGAIRALVGGMGFALSKFNRATQARRQPGSNFKPFLYASALSAGVTPATVINDAPVVLDNIAAAEIWRPENDSGKFYGPTRLREALAFSRNLVSIRVLQRVGIGPFIRYVESTGL